MEETRFSRVYLTSFRSFAKARDHSWGSDRLDHPYLWDSSGCKIRHRSDYQGVGCGGGSRVMLA